MSVINTNVSSLIAQNAMAGNARAQSTAMQQLSSGLRINGAKDDAAGLAIASKMTSQIKGLDQAVRNANDAISMMQTADGSLSTVSDMMQRMRELAVQSSSDTNVSSDRTALQDEFKQLKTEINRITQNTQWNGMNILDGSANNNTGTFNFQVGANGGQTISAQVDKLGFGASSISAATATAGDGVAEAATTTLTGATFKEGDVITLNANNQQFQYTVTKTVADAATAAELDTQGDGIGVLGDAVTNALQAVNSDHKFAGLDVTAASGDGVIVLTGNTNVANGFSASSATSSGGLASLDALDISTPGGASAAISGVDTAIAAVNSQRSSIGAVINRLTYAADNLANVSQNASASRSRIQDTDYAKTSTELARTQIIAQAATAMLAQANQSQQSVLALLK